MRKEENLYMNINPAKKPKGIARSRAEKIGQGIIVAYLFLFSLCMIYPFWRVIMHSFSDGKQALNGGLFFLPEGFSLYGYEVVLKNKQIWIAYRNTIAKTIVGTGLSLLLSSMTAYPLSVKRLHGRTAINGMIFFTMLFSGGMIPIYLLVKSLGMLDTFAALVIPGCLSAYNTFILRNFMQSIPGEMEESARIDGANVTTILFRIILPLSAPSLAAIAMFYGVNNWNSYFDCLLYTSSSNLQTLQLYLRNVLQQTSSLDAIMAPVGESVSDGYLSEEQIQMVVIAVSIIPILIVYPWLQRFYTKGITVGAVKG